MAMERENRAPRAGGPNRKRKKVCQFCVDKCEYIDYKDAAKLRRFVSTRTFQKAAAARMAGVPLKEVKADIFAGWTRDELAKVA